MLTNAIREGSDIYFVCTIDANPAIRDLTWTHDGMPIVSEPANGVIISNYSLVLQKVKRQNRGHYQCMASNQEGLAESNQIFLRVLREFFTHSNLTTQQQLIDLLTPIYHRSNY